MRLASLFLATTLCASSGCAYFAATPPLEAAPAEIQATNDVPLPAGFELDKSASHRHERDGYRRYQLVYRRADYLSEARVREFVLAAYEQAGWKLRFLWGLDKSEFLFQRGSEECQVRVFEDFGDRYTQLEVRLRPRETPDGTLMARKSNGAKPSQAIGTKRSVKASANRPRK
jgi:hypothetical protein